MFTTTIFLGIFLSGGKIIKHEEFLKKICGKRCCLLAATVAQLIECPFSTTPPDDVKRTGHA